LNQEEKISSTLGDIQNFYLEFNRSTTCNDYEFLESSFKRRELVQKATTYNDSIEFITPFNNLNVEQETI